MLRRLWHVRTTQRYHPPACASAVRTPILLFANCWLCAFKHATATYLPLGCSSSLHVVNILWDHWECSLNPHRTVSIASPHPLFTTVMIWYHIWYKPQITIIMKWFSIVARNSGVNTYAMLPGNVMLLQNRMRTYERSACNAMLMIVIVDVVPNYSLRLRIITKSMLLHFSFSTAF